MNIHRLAAVAVAVSGAFAATSGLAQEAAAPLSETGNFSLGGKVRAGPGMDHGQVGSLQYGDAVVLLERTGVLMGDYEWFHIAFGDGKRGYHWGGIMCTLTPGISGTFPCPDDLKAEVTGPDISPEIVTGDADPGNAPALDQPVKRP